jgi:hypothetical protein
MLNFHAEALERTLSLAVVTFFATRHLLNMRAQCAAILFCASLLASVACGPRQTEEQRHADANTPAGKLGQAAHKAAVQLDKAGRVVGKKMDKAAHDAHEGWKEAQRKDSDKK